MAKIYPLFSSSNGNTEFIGTEKGGILIDCGVNYKRLVDCLKINNIPLSAIQGVFVTHEHSDHVTGLKMFTKNNRIKIYGQKYTLQNLCTKDRVSPDTELVELTEKPVFCGDCEITCFDTPHDTVQSCGYKIRTYDGKLCAVCTDLGHVTDTIRNELKGCRLVMIESNYDAYMLKNGVYPGWLKERILSSEGHLSNDDCGQIVRYLVTNGTTHIILGHLSQQNNTPVKADSTVQNYLSDFTRGKDYIMSVAPVVSKGGNVVF